MIRQATEEDSQIINELGLLITKDFIQLNNVAQQIADQINEYYVYEQKGKIRGFINVIVLDQEIEIIYLVVAKEYRNLGIATKLVNYVLTKYPRKTILLEVNENNSKALSIYQKVGFKIINKRPNYYQDEAAIIMRKDN